MKADGDHGVSGHENVGWTLPTLKAYYDAILQEHAVAHRAEHLATDRAMDAALQSAKEAIDKAAVAVEGRFASVNEFRQMVNDILAKAMPRVEAENRLSVVDERARVLELGTKDYMTIKSFDRFLEKQSETARDDRRQRTGWAFAIGLALLTSVVFPLLLNHV